VILKLIGYYLRHPKQLAGGLWRKFKRIPPVHAVGATAKSVGKASRTEERVKVLEETLEAALKENKQLQERVERLEISRTIRKKSALEMLAREAAEEGAEERAADPKRNEAYGKVIERIRGTGGEKTCAVDLGCGNGFRMEAMVKQGLTVVGVDAGEKAIAACREKKLNAVCADEADWMRDCQSGAADLVVVEKAEAIGCEKVAEILAEAARVLRDGGAAVVEIGENRVAAPVKAEMIEAVARHIGMKTETVRFKSGCAVICSKE